MSWPNYRKAHIIFRVIVFLNTENTEGTENLAVQIFGSSISVIFVVLIFKHRGRRVHRELSGTNFWICRHCDLCEHSGSNF